MSQVIETDSPIIRTSANRRLWLWAMSFVVVFTLALALDVPLSTWAHQSTVQTIKALPFWKHTLIRIYGIFWFTAAAAVTLLLRDLYLRRRAWPSLGKDAALVLLSGVFSGINAFLKWAIGRIRPFHDVPPFKLHFFIGGWHGLWPAEQNLSFPSGDVTLAFAMTGSLMIVAPRLTVLWWVLGLWIAFERVAEGAHYPSDTVAGAALGFACAAAARRVIDLLEKRTHAPAR